MANQPTLAALADDLAGGRTSAVALTEACLAAIDDEQGEGARAFISVDRDGALAQARAMDAARAASRAPSRFAGIPISIKDMFDVEGQLTQAGAKAISDLPPAKADAPAVTRLRQAGFVLIGRANMSEFAFSGLGLNPHFDTPRGPWDRAGRGRVPGGSTSGGAVSVADGMAHATLGTDTGGSCRIPAAFCGIVGFKPTARRVPLDGTVPLSTSLDSVGPLARSVACCAALDAILSKEAAPVLGRDKVSGLRLAIPKTYVLDGMEGQVAQAFERTLSLLSQAGALVTEIEMPEFGHIPTINAKGGFPAPEAYAWHRPFLERHGDLYDPRIRARIERGKGQSAVDYIDLLGERRAFIAGVSARISGFDALVYPTTPILPPRIADLDADEAFTTANLLALRNPTVINLLDGCAISLPMQRMGEPPMGLMLAALGGQDQALLRHAAAVEALLGSVE
ncbi:MAG TPA: amidase [Stellaceae bacterium]|nr:amidase [Stellaceae bacterium]